MKTTSLLLIILLTQFSLSAQDIKGNMENWRNYSSGFPFPSVQLEAPEGWYGLDSLVVVGAQMMQISGNANIRPSKQIHKSSDAHNGAHAAMLVSKTLDTFGVIPGVLSNARINVDLLAVMSGGDFMNAIDYTGGTPINNRITGIEAWVKYQTPGADSASILIAAVLTGQAADGNDSVIAAGATMIGATNGYIAVTTPLIYADPNAIPDKLIVGFSSSSGENGTDGSTLYVDDVSITGGSGSRVPAISTRQAVTCYPNPSNGIIYLQASQMPVTWTAYDITGKQIYQTTWAGATTADCSLYPPGMYLYRVTDQNGATLQTGNFTLL